MSRRRAGHPQGSPGVIPRNAESMLLPAIIRHDLMDRCSRDDVA